MNLKYTAFLTAALMLSACGDSPRLTNTPPSPSPTPSPKPETTDFYVSPTCSDCRTTVATETWGGFYKTLGYGYDATAGYLSAGAMRARVVDLSRLDDGRMTVFAAPASGSGDQYTGYDAADFLSTLSGNSGLENLPSGYYFAGTLNTPSTNASYILNIQWVRKTIGNINTLGITSALSDEFQADLKTLKAGALVRKYGTHFISRANMGLAVRTLYSAYADTDTKDKISKATKGMEAAEASLAGSLGPDLAMTLASLSNYGATLTKTFSGGDPRLIEYDSQTGLLGSFSDWMDSGDSENYALISLSEGALTPLSEVVADPTLRKEVESAIREYVTQSQAAEDTTVPLLQNSNGKVYRYVTGYEESLKLETEKGIYSYGVLGSLYKNSAPGAIPLYSKVASDGSQTLSLIQPTYEWSRIGYVLQKRTDDCVPLYEITDGTRYAYTIEAANSMGPRKEWHPTGVVFYLLRP